MQLKINFLSLSFSLRRTTLMCNIGVTFSYQPNIQPQTADNSIFLAAK
jgi:hypothetical protein